MNISRDKQDFLSKVWQQKLCDLRISRGRFFAPYFGGQKLDLYAEKYGNHPKGWMDESGVKIWIEKVILEFQIICLFYLTDEN